jgi:choline-glycine betaine transporter
VLNICCCLGVAWSCYRTLASLEATCTFAATAADSLDYLLAVVTNGAEEHPPLQAVEAVSLLSAAFVHLVGRGVLRALR